MGYLVTYWIPLLRWIRHDQTLHPALLPFSLSRLRIGRLRLPIAGGLRIILHNTFSSLGLVPYPVAFSQLLISPLVPLYPYINSWFRTSAHPTLLTAPSFLLPFTFPFVHLVVFRSTFPNGEPVFPSYSLPILSSASRFVLIFLFAVCPLFPPSIPCEQTSHVVLLRLR